MTFGTFSRLTTRSILDFVDVAAARSGFEFSVCLGILELSELGHRRMVPTSSMVGDHCAVPNEMRLVPSEKVNRTRCIDSKHKFEKFGSPMFDRCLFVGPMESLKKTPLSDLELVAG